MRVMLFVDDIELNKKAMALNPRKFVEGISIVKELVGC